MSEKSRFSAPFHMQHGKPAQTLLQSGRRHLCHIHWLLTTLFRSKKSILVLCKILRLFVNTLTADGKYFLLNRDKLTQPIQILLSLKQKTFSRFSSAFLKSALKFERFQKKDDHHRRCISKIMDSQKGGLINVSKILFQRTLPQATW